MTTDRPTIARIIDGTPAQGGTEWPRSLAQSFLDADAVAAEVNACGQYVPGDVVTIVYSDGTTDTVTATEGAA